MNKNQDYEIFPDKFRIIMTGTTFAFFAIAIGAITLLRTNFVWKILAVIFAVLFMIAAVRIFKELWVKTPAYVINATGVTDNTQKVPVVVPWAEMMKIEMVPNNAVMQIGILAQKTVTSQTEKTHVLTKNLFTNGNMAFYSVMIDGFKYSKKHFLAIFEELQRQGVQHNPKILVSGYNVGREK
ncbi:hypothetical protein [Levilactobacillus zymae]|uniref:hypothetical protein n=1 Tax=Levilactobacillus zymae TaxID=267363 RepID=UPI0028BBE0BC|nr:hypothetical protein [Levilactobacillus zymae]MDT6981560.1 hypothetical protein [Levilactobacillus zymae]